jgi:transposase
MNNLFWLADEQWQTIKPFLPIRHTGPRRVDDRRVISGIVHVLRSGCRWRDCPREYGPHTTIYNRFNRWSSRELWQTIFAALVSVGEAPRLLMADSSAAKAHRSASGGRMGEIRQAVGRSRGGRTTKVHALTDEQGRPHAFLLTGGQVADIKGAASLLTSMPPSQKFVGDKAYDADHLRGWLGSRGTVPIIPNKANRRQRYPFDEVAYRSRNIIERMFCRLKDFRRIATRYDKLARNFLAGICLVATIIWWVN